MIESQKNVPSVTENFVKIIAEVAIYFIPMVMLMIVLYSKEKMLNGTIIAVAERIS